MDCNELDKRTKAYKECVESKGGLGDMVATATKAVGIKPCAGCEKRRQKLNILGHRFEYFFKKNRPNDFTEEDLKLWEEFRNTSSDKLYHNEQDLIIRLLKDVLNMSFKPCRTCAYKQWLEYIKMINYVYEKQVVTKD